MSSILTAKKIQVFHYEVPANEKNLIFDEAIEELTEICEKIPCEEITSLTFHTNSWGMSCSKYFGEKAMVKMTNLTRLEWADIIKAKPRSDLCMSTAAMLYICKDHKIEYIDLSDNLLEADGGKAFNEWLWTNSSLKVLKLTNTKVGKRTAELLLEAWEENKDLQIEEFYLANNEFINEKSMKVFGKFFGLMKSCRVLDISNNVTCGDHKALKWLLEGLVLSKNSLVELNISNNKSINCEGTLDVLCQLLTDNLQLKILNISNLGMNKDNCDKLLAFLKIHFTKSWNLNNNLQKLIWDKDLSCSKQNAKKFITEFVGKIYNRKL